MVDQTQDQGEWRVAKMVENYEEAVVVAGFLKSCGVPAELDSLHVDELPVNVGGLGEVRVRVPADRFEEAVALLAENERQTGSAAARAASSEDAGEG
jgi:hypothetical protein